MNLDRIDRIWLGLLAATAVTFWVGETGTGGGAWPVLTIFVLAAIKGAYIALDFMELRHAPLLWRRLVIGWLALVVALILVAWGLAGSIGSGVR